MAPRNLERSVMKSFQSAGFSLRPPAKAAIVSHLLAHEQAWQNELQTILRFFKENFERSVAVEEEHIRKAIGSRGRVVTGGALGVPEIHVVSAFDIPRYRYDEAKRAFEKVETLTKRQKVFADGSMKTACVREHFALVKQRLLNHASFREATLPFEDKARPKLTIISSLRDGEGTQYVLGMISQMRVGRLFLEDLTGSIELDLADISEDRQTSGYFTEGSIVVVEGEVENGKLYAQSIGMPPAEERQAAIRASSNTDFFLTLPPPNLVEGLKAEAEDASLLCLSDVWVDDDTAMAVFEEVLQGYSDHPNPSKLCFALLGNFTSPQDMAPTLDSVQKGMEKLAQIMKKYPSLCNESMWVFVPGPKDTVLTVADVLPILPFHLQLQQPFARVLKHCVFASNPCRIRFFHREVLIFRYDTLRLFRRYSVLKPSSRESSDPQHHLLKTVLEQSHLCPFPLSRVSRYWELDHTLRTYPLPDSVILSQGTDSFSLKIEGCACASPGPLAAPLEKRGQFIGYDPVSNAFDEYTL